MSVTMGFRLVSVVFAVFVLGASLAYADSSDVRRYLDRGHALTKAGKPEQALPYLLMALELGEANFAAEDSALVPLLDSLAETHSANGIPGALGAHRGSPVAARRCGRGP